MKISCVILLIGEWGVLRVVAVVAVVLLVFGVLPDLRLAIAAGFLLVVLLGSGMHPYYCQESSCQVRLQLSFQTIRSVRKA